NSSPVARSLNTSVPQGGVANILFDLGKYKLATDADGDTVTIASAYGATNASLGVAANGLSMSYTNTGGSAGTFDAFNYTVSTGFANGGYVSDNNPSGWQDSHSVSGLGSSLSITDVRVSLNISGGWNGDLYGYLLYQPAGSGTGTLMVLLDRVGQPGVTGGY